MDLRLERGISFVVGTTTRVTQKIQKGAIRREFSKFGTFQTSTRSAEVQNVVPRSLRPEKSIEIRIDYRQ